MTGGSLARRRPSSGIPCRSAGHRRRDPILVFPSPMTAGAHLRGGGAALTRFARGAARWSRLREPAAGCLEMPFVVSRVRGALTPGWPPSMTCAGCARSARARFAEGVHSPFASTSSEKCQRLGSPSGRSFRSPPSATRRHVRPTSAAHIFRFQRAPAPRAATDVRLGGRASCASMGRPRNHGWSSRFGGPAPFAWWIGTRRSLPRPTGPAEPLTLRHRAGGWSPKLQLSSGAIEVGQCHRFP